MASLAVGVITLLQLCDGLVEPGEVLGFELDTVRTSKTNASRDTLFSCFQYFDSVVVFALSVNMSQVVSEEERNSSRTAGFLCWVIYSIQVYIQMSLLLLSTSLISRRLVRPD